MSCSHFGIKGIGMKNPERKPWITLKKLIHALSESVFITTIYINMTITVLKIKPVKIVTKNKTKLGTLAGKLNPIFVPLKAKPSTIIGKNLNVAALNFLAQVEANHLL